MYFCGSFTYNVALIVPIVEFIVIIATDNANDALVIHYFSLYSLIPSLLSFW